MSAAFGIGVIVVAGSPSSPRCARRTAAAPTRRRLALDAVTVVCVVGIVAAIALGIYIMTDK